jgi:hypothetical protein|tara:strand:- start:281 stop:1048 length:768 start_codon:yes stop_codon:yes gene_type:complete
MDLNAIKKRLNQLQTSNTRTSNLWKPQPGSQVVRIVPYKFNRDNPFIELYFHYDLGGKNYLSPISFGRPDPIEEFAQKLKSAGSKDDYRLGRKIEAKMRTFAPVVVRNEEKEGVRFWGFGKTVYQELLSIIADPDYGDITDAVSGRDVAIEFKTAEETGKSFPSTSIRVKPNQTPITEDASVLEAIKETQKNITEIYQERSYDELTQALNDYLNGGTEENKSETKSEDTTKKVTVDPSTYDSQKTSEAFDDLFNN